MRSVANSPIGPLLQALLTLLWRRLFEPSSPIYLPNIIKNGDPSLGLPSYDPASFANPGQQFLIPGVPHGVSDSACSSDVPISPIATADPQLQLLNLQLIGLSEMIPQALSFAPNNPQFTATVSVGTQAIPFVMTTDITQQPNFTFSVACCEPVNPTSRQCSATTQPWTADAQGNFSATLYAIQISLTSQLNTPSNSPPSITILNISVNVPPSQINLTFNVDNLDSWAQQMAQFAVQQGVVSGSLVQAVQMFLNQDSVRGDIEQLINDQLKKITQAADSITDPAT